MKNDDRDLMNGSEIYWFGSGLFWNSELYHETSIINNLLWYMDSYNIDFVIIKTNIFCTNYIYQVIFY